MPSISWLVFSAIHVRRGGRALRTLRPEYGAKLFRNTNITYVSLVHWFEKLAERIASAFRCAAPGKRRVFRVPRRHHKALTKSRPRLGISRFLLKQVTKRLARASRHHCGGAFSEPQTLQFFYDLGIPVANGYGLTEAGTAITVNDLKPFRADTVGKPLPGMEVRIVNPAVDGVGEVPFEAKPSWRAT